MARVRIGVGSIDVEINRSEVSIAFGIGAGWRIVLRFVAARVVGVIHQQSVLAGSVEGDALPRDGFPIRVDKQGGHRRGAFRKSRFIRGAFVLLGECPRNEYLG